MKKVIVTGVTGQDGSHMCDFLLANTDYMIYGSARRLSVKNHENIIHLENNSRFKLINMDLNDAHSIRDVVLDIKPDYFINFAAQSFVAGSWDYPIQTWDTDATSVLHILESIRRFSPNTRFYNAGSSEEFGDVITSPQDEEHPLRPQSPYGASKCAARHIVRVYSESYNLFAVQGWLFNHEGSRRGLDFVTRKITHNVARIKKAIEEKKDIPVFELGNLDAKRDWSDAEDFMPGVWMMLNQDKAKNYVLSSGETHTIREFAEECFKCAEIYGDWVFPEGNQDAENEVFKKDTGEILLKVNKKFYRPAEVYELCGDATKAINELGWIPKCSFKELVRKMYKTDYNLLNE
jgi:GDPmannose 4,6-dehydratase